MLKTKSGFTLVELLIVVAVLGVLATIGSIGFGRTLANIRDDARQSKVTVIAEALEKYYQRNGEYPSVPAITDSDTAAVLALLEIPDDDAITMPQAASGTNSITATTASATQLAYNGLSDDSAENTLCQTDPDAGCDEFTLQWIDEDGTNGEVESRQRGRIFPLQSFLATSCSSLTTYTGSNESAVKILTDSRDGTAYRIAKLADGKCWMLDNLKLGSTTNTTLLKSSNTNITDNWTLPQVASSSDTSDWISPGYLNPLATAVPGDTGSGTTNYGYLYNWCAATAGGTNSGGNETCTDSVTYPDTPASNDICPKGWRLPTGDTGGDFSNLDVAFGGTGVYASGGPSFSSWQYTGPFKGVLAGARLATSFVNQGSYGSWQSQTASSSDPLYAFNARINSTDEIYPGTNTSYRAYGYAIRCLLN